MRSRRATRSEIAVGNASDNTIYGNDLDNTLLGKGGNDVMLGGKGNDTCEVTEAGDHVIEMWARATTPFWPTSTTPQPANVEMLSLQGTAAIGNDNALNNTISGNAATSQLNGYRGDDVLTGGGGIDAFWRLADGAGKDTITDFAPVQLERIVRDSHVSPTTPAVQAAESQVKTDVVITLDANTTLTLQNVAIAQLSSSNFSFTPVPIDGRQSPASSRARDKLSRMRATSARVTRSCVGRLIPRAPQAVAFG